MEEAIAAQSKRDFISKIGISYKEARETLYWLRLLRESGYVEKNQTELLLKECDEIIRILGSIQLTARKKEEIKNYE